MCKQHKQPTTLSHTHTHTHHTHTHSHTHHHHHHHHHHHYHHRRHKKRGSRDIASDRWLVLPGKCSTASTKKISLRNLAALKAFYARLLEEADGP